MYTFLLIINLIGMILVLCGAILYIKKLIRLKNYIPAFVISGLILMILSTLSSVLFLH